MAGSPAARLHPPLAAFFRVIATNTVGGQVKKRILRLFFYSSKWLHSNHFQY